MAKPPVLDDIPAFKALPVQRVTLGRAGDEIAVHVAGSLAGGRPAVLCLAGYNRNMADFTEFVPLLHRLLKTDWPVALLDLRGRGRSSKRAQAGDYTTTNDAHDVSTVARALGIGSAIVVGQGHGGQVAMALALERPALIAGIVLMDAGPTVTPQSLVRLRSNVETITGFRGTGGLTSMLRRMMAANYPETQEAELDKLAARTHVIDPDGRAVPLYDRALIARLSGFAHDDVLEPQWQFYDLLRHMPVMLLRTELTDQLPQAVLEEMMRRRPEALAIAVARQGSPALLDRVDEIGAIAEFIRRTAAEAQSSRRG